MILLMHIFGRCWGIWASIRLQVGKERLTHSSVHLKRHLWSLNIPVSQLLDLCPPPSPHRFQHQWRRLMRFCPCHRTHWPLQAWHGRHVLLLFLLWWNSTSLRPCLHFPNVALSLRCYFPPFHPLSDIGHSLHVGIPTLVPYSREIQRSHKNYAEHS